jgi:hypothetical protein
MSDVARRIAPAGRRSRRAGSIALGAAGALAGLLFSIEATPGGGLALSAGSTAHAALAACTGPNGLLHICEDGDYCSLDCPLVNNPGQTVEANALAYRNALYALVGASSACDFQPDPSMYYDCVWSDLTQKYAASIAARGIDAAGLLAMKDFLWNDPAIIAPLRVRITEHYLVSGHSSTEDPETTDTEAGCPATLPLDPWDDPPGSWVVPEDLGGGKTKYYQDDSDPELKPFGSLNPPNHFPYLTGRDMGRLRDDLRDVAAGIPSRYSTREIICRSAVAFYGNDPATGKALADLTVTGRRAFADFRNNSMSIAFYRQDAYCRNQLPADDAVKDTWITTALERAFRVANVLHVGMEFGSPEYVTKRIELGYIAVSSEDDKPYRPVNVPSAHFEQFDLDVEVPVRLKPAEPPVIVRTRYMLAATGAPAPTVPASTLFSLPQETDPSLPQDAEVILFVHGMGSRLEEALDLTRELHGRAAEKGKNYVILAMDLPTSGYATDVSHFDISPLSALGGPRTEFIINGPSLIPLTGFDHHGYHNAPVLDFNEDFVVEFVDALDDKLYGRLKPKIKAVVGGSLGGNLGLRLGRRTDIPWLPRVVAWDPGSIWRSYGDGGEWDPSSIVRHVPVASTWYDAGGDPDKICEGWDAVLCPGNLGRRWNYFKDFFFNSPGFVADLVTNLGPGEWQNVGPNPDVWYSDKWACKESENVQNLRYFFETYTPEGRLWHWRLAAEQLLYSHHSDGDNPRPIHRNFKPHLLMAGEDDNYAWTHFYDATQEAADLMTITPGYHVNVLNTGHSMHIERPKYMARKIDEFVQRSGYMSPCESVSGMFAGCPADLVVALQVPGYQTSCPRNLTDLYDGFYTIDPDGPGGELPFEVYCDVHTDGGGWAMVHNSANWPSSSGFEAVEVGDFWKIPYEDRFGMHGQEDFSWGGSYVYNGVVHPRLLGSKLFNGRLYLFGTEYRDEIVHFNMDPVAVQVSVAGIDPATMKFLSPVKTAGSDALFDMMHYADAVWGAHDHSTGFPDPAAQASYWTYGGPSAQHYGPNGMLWSLSGCDATETRGWGPHVHVDAHAPLGLPVNYGETGDMKRVQRITRWARW